MKTRAELLSSKGYWIAKLQIELFRELDEFKKKKKMNNTQLANHLGYTKGYVTQLLNGNFNYKLSKIVELSLAIGKAPKLEFQDLNSYISEDCSFGASSSSGAGSTYEKDNNYSLAA